MKKIVTFFVFLALLEIIFLTFEQIPYINFIDWRIVLGFICGFFFYDEFIKKN